MSVFNSTKDSDEESVHDFKLNDLHLLYNSTGKKDSYLSSNQSESGPIRLQSMFSNVGSFSSLPVNKREKKAEGLKQKVVSQDPTFEKLPCKCCGKSDISISEITSLNSSEALHLCIRCSSALQKKQDYASTFNGTAKISDKGSNMVEYTCDKGHSWTVNIHRAYKSWCSTCRKLFREERKQHFRRQSSQIRKENADRQKELFNEAQNQYFADAAEASYSIEHFEDLFNSVLPIANVKASEFMDSLDAPTQCTYEQALAVYKVLEVDANRVKFILNGMDTDSRKSGYKKLAMTLHPDKNRHPLSKEAFQKASELFNSSI